MVLRVRESRLLAHSGLVKRIHATYIVETIFDPALFLVKYFLSLLCQILTGTEAANADSLPLPGACPKIASHRGRRGGEAGSQSPSGGRGRGRGV